MIEPEKIKKIFEYLYNPTTDLVQANGAFVFCRDDPLVAARAAELYHNNLVGYIMVTGGLGKDSGYLAALEIPEAKWQSGLLSLVHKVPPDKIYIESTATNGGENSRLGIDTIVAYELPHQELITVVHPTQLRRVNAVQSLETEKKGFKTHYQRTATRYQFDPKNPIDQKEALAELIRLADWPAKCWCPQQEDLPEDLVTFAREAITRY